MTIKKRPMSSDGSSLERRKSRRYPVVVPVEVSWRGTDGVAVKHDAVARQVNANGGYLKMAMYPDAGARVTLANFISAQTADARVIAAPQGREGVSHGIIVELITPSESFWGVDLQVKKTILELQNLDKALQTEDMDLRLVKEYRESVDSIRTSAETLEKLRECQFRNLEDNELLAELSASRVQRVVALAEAMIEDIDAGRLKRETSAVDNLYRAIDDLRERLRPVGRPR